MVLRVEELLLLCPAKGIHFAFGSLLALILVLFGSRGGGLPDALPFFGMRGYESSYLDCCVMFSSFLSLEGG